MPKPSHLGSRKYSRAVYRRASSGVGQHKSRHCKGQLSAKTQPPCCRHCHPQPGIWKVFSEYCGINQVAVWCDLCLLCFLTFPFSSGFIFNWCLHSLREREGCLGTGDSVLCGQVCPGFPGSVLYPQCLACLPACCTQPLPATCAPLAFCPYWLPLHTRASSFSPHFQCEFAPSLLSRILATHRRHMPTCS